MRLAKTRRGWFRWALVVVAVGMVFAAVAAPAMAQVETTTLTATPTATTLTYGAGLWLSAELKSGDSPVGAQQVKLMQSDTGTGSWTLLYTLTTSDAPYAAVVYTGPVVPLQTKYYQFVFDGAGEYGASVSNVVQVAVKPILGKPVCPAKATHGKKFTVSGTIKPAFPADEKTVTIKVYRLKGGKWVAMSKAYAATNVDFQDFASKYVARFSLAKAGKYKFKAMTTTSASFVGVTSGFSRVLTVK